MQRFIKSRVRLGDMVEKHQKLVVCLRPLKKIHGNLAKENHSQSNCIVKKKLFKKNTWKGSSK